MSIANVNVNRNLLLNSSYILESENENRRSGKGPDEQHHNAPHLRMTIVNVNIRGPVLEPAPNPKFGVRCGAVLSMHPNPI